MDNNNGRAFPIVLTILIIGIIVYLFATIKQPYVECNRQFTDDLGIVVKENIVTTFGGNKIDTMKVTKTIILPDEYAKKKYVDSIKYSLENSLKYLGSKKVKYEVFNNKVVARITIDKDETVILNNIEFIDNDGLQIKINSNTKSSEVVTLKIGENYTQGQFMTRLKNNGYVCK